MIEATMYFGIGFLIAALLGLLFAPLLHNRAVRLTTRRLDAATPLSIIEVRADKDQLRAEFSMSIRRLETSIERMKTKTAYHLVQISRKTEAINELKKELDEKAATILRETKGKRVGLGRTGCVGDARSHPQGSRRRLPGCGGRRHT